MWSDRQVVRGLIFKLGGATEIAHWCQRGLTRNAIYVWAYRNEVPWPWRATVADMAEAKGVKLTAGENKVLAIK